MDVMGKQKSVVKTASLQVYWEATGRLVSDFREYGRNILIFQ